MCRFARFTAVVMVLCVVLAAAAPAHADPALSPP
jgi:hypothetical protein